MKMSECKHGVDRIAGIFLCDDCTIEELQDENERYKAAIEIARNFISFEGDCNERAVRKELEQALSGQKGE